MGKRFELSMEILDKKYVDSLIVALARQGYAPYISYDNTAICITIDDSTIREVDYEKVVT